MNKEKEYDILDLLGWKDITTSKQYKNGTRIFQLPIKKYGQFIEVGSFESGYVRRMNGCYTPYQLNKTENYDHFYKEYEYRGDGKSKWTGKYNYCLKNYYINQANEVKDQKYTWSGGQITDGETGEIYVHEQHAYWNKAPNSVQVIVDGHRYNVK